MRTIRFLLEKEFRQIFRNKSILVLILVMPIVQLIILPMAADYEVRNIKLSVVDQDHSQYSRELIRSIQASGYFKLVEMPGSYQSAYTSLAADRCDLILEVPAGFERKLIRENRQELLIAVNAINGVKANLGGAYLNTILRRFNMDIRLRWMVPKGLSPLPQIEIRSSNWYNPLMNYKLFMVPGILAVLVTMIGAYLTALNIVKEKETGTIEQINVSPIRKYHFILGKLIPFWILGLLVFTLGMIAARIFYGIVPAGSIALLYGFIALYLIAVLGLGLLISTFCDTQQQAMFIAFFFVMIFILMGGLFTSIDSMPVWAQYIARCNPISYLIEIMRMVVLKGSGFEAMRQHFAVILAFAVGLNVLAVLNYRKTM